jgi:hypothetical protein
MALSPPDFLQKKRIAHQGLHHEVFPVYALRITLKKAKKGHKKVEAVSRKLS